MKKILSIIIVVIMTGCFCVPAFASEEIDLFYFSNNDSEVSTYVNEFENDEDLKNEIFDYHAMHIERFILEDDQIVDKSKITHGYDEKYASHNWEDNTEFIEFLNSDNRLEFLKNKEVLYYVIPVYYDGIYLDEYETIITDLFGNDQIQVSNHLGMYNKEDPYINNRNEIISKLAEDGITGYDIIYAANSAALGLVLAQKDGQEYVILYPCEKYYDFHEVNRLFYEENKSVFEKRVLTVDEAITFLNARQLFFDEYIKNKPDGIDGMGLKSNTEFPYWIIGVIVGVIAIAAVTVIVIKKKKV